MAGLFKRPAPAILMIFIWLSFNISYSCYGQVQVEDSSPLSLKDAIAIAFLNNKDIQIQEEEIEAAKAKILGAESEFLPKVNVGYGYTYNGASLNLGSLLPKGFKKDAGIFIGYENDNKLNLSVDESVYNGGANIANFKQSKLGLRVQKELLRAKKLDVEFDTKRLYYGLLLAYETERITQDLFDQAQAHYEDVKNKFEQGTSSKFDVLQSKIQVSKIMPELIKAKNAVDLIRADLKKLLGLKMKDAIRLKDTMVYFPMEIGEEKFLKQAYQNKPEMILRLLGVDISKLSIESAMAGIMPQVNASFDYTYKSNNPENMVDYKHTNWSAGASVTIPIFDGFSTKAKVDEARARYMQSTLGKEDLVEQIAVDIRRACLDLKQAESIINSQKDNIEEAKEALKISNVSYDNGVGTNLDVMDAQVSLSQIEKNLSEAIYDYIMARASLDRTMGQEFFEEVKNEKKD